MKRIVWLSVALVSMLAVPVRADWLIDNFRWSGSAGDASAIEIRNEYGDIRTRSTSTGELEVTAVIQRLDTDPYRADIRIEPDGKTVRIEVAYVEDSATVEGAADNEWEKRRVDITVMIPMASMLTATSPNGRVEAKGHGGRVVARSETGDIVVTTSGSAQLQTDRGHIKAAFSDTDWEAPSTLTTTTGDITVALPADANLKVEATTLGEISTDFSIAIRHDVDTAKKTATARIGRGRHNLRIGTVKGKVRLVRSRR